MYACIQMSNRVPFLFILECKNRRAEKVLIYNNNFIPRGVLFYKLAL